MSLSPIFLNPARRAWVMAGLCLMVGGVLADESLPLNLSGKDEVPPVDSQAQGSGYLLVRSVDHDISGELTLSGMMATMAHIHEAPAGQAGPVVITLVKTGDASFEVPANTRLSEGQYASYVAGNLYVNVHSVAYPHGEIRAQILPNQALAGSSTVDQ